MQPVLATSRPVGGFFAFIAAVFVFTGVINSAMLHRPAVAASIKTASWLKTDKVQDRLALALPPCRRIRKEVKENGIDAVIAEARRRGYSEAQINEARNCLKKES